MDFVKILRSLEEFLYEVMSWLAFYPRTLARIVLHPVAASRYVTMQMTQPPEQQFTEAISPPLMLILSLLLAHAAEVVLAPPLDIPHNPIAEAIFGTQEGLLLFRSVCFAVFALIAALSMLRRSRQRLDRDTLRTPFYIQCFLTAPFALLVSIALTVARTRDGWAATAAAVVATLSVAWYLLARARVFTQIDGSGQARSLLVATTNFMLAILLVGAATAALVQTGNGA